MQNHDALRVRRAKQIVRSELNSYDLLSRKAKIHRSNEHEHHACDEHGPDKGYVCGHKVSLCSPCEKCQRSEADCVEYRVQLQAKLKELLNVLKSSKV
jgi:hypothetical protein